MKKKQVVIKIKVKPIVYNISDEKWFSKKQLEKFDVQIKSPKKRK